MRGAHCVQQRDCRAGIRVEAPTKLAIELRRLGTNTLTATPRLNWAARTKSKSSMFALTGAYSLDQLRHPGEPALFGPHLTS
jgi:hypothetical protein